MTLLITTKGTKHVYIHLENVFLWDKLRNTERVLRSIDEKEIPWEKDHDSFQEWAQASYKSF